MEKIGKKVIKKPIVNTSNGKTIKSMLIRNNELIITFRVRAIIRIIELNKLLTKVLISFSRFEIKVI